MVSGFRILNAFQLKYCVYSFVLKYICFNFFLGQILNYFLLQIFSNWSQLRRHGNKLFIGQPFYSSRLSLEPLCNGQFSFFYHFLTSLRKSQQLFKKYFCFQIACNYRIQNSPNINFLQTSTLKNINKSNPKNHFYFHPSTIKTKMYTVIA